VKLGITLSRTFRIDKEDDAWKGINPLVYSGEAPADATKLDKKGSQAAMGAPKKSQRGSAFKRLSMAVMGRPSQRTSQMAGNLQAVSEDGEEDAASGGGGIAKSQRGSAFKRVSMVVMGRPSQRTSQMAGNLQAVSEDGELEEDAASGGGRIAKASV
jgi:hypothetical protein